VATMTWLTIILASVATWLAVGLIFWLGSLITVRRFAQQKRLPAPPIRLDEGLRWTLFGPVMPVLVLIAVALTTLESATEPEPARKVKA
jgi:hypothetical protein